MLRISGPQAGEALTALAGALPRPRRASLRTLRDPAHGEPLDTALLLWFPGPATSTGEDLAEIHAHGGRGTVRAIERALVAMSGLRPAEPGEFTRRALFNGRIDLAQAEGLADLLQAETELQRRSALAVAGGGLSRAVEAWQEKLLALSAQVEAILDFSDDDDVADADLAIEQIVAAKQELAASWRSRLARPASEALRDGVRVAIAGPPNAGKSTLLNALAQREAAIVSPLAGTTRDIVEVPLALDGIPFRFADTAGLRSSPGDTIEAMGIERARAWIAASDIVLWLGSPDRAPSHPCVLRIAAKADRIPGIPCADGMLALSAISGEGMDALHRELVQLAGEVVPRADEIALNLRHREALGAAADALSEAGQDPLLIAEQLRFALRAVDGITGSANTEAMLDTLFGRFCIGK